MKTLSFLTKSDIRKYLLLYFTQTLKETETKEPMLVNYIFLFKRYK